MAKRSKQYSFHLILNNPDHLKIYRTLEDLNNVVIPFDNQISKDTDLYRLYNTNIHEIIENSRLSHLSKPK